MAELRIWLRSHPADIPPVDAKDEVLQLREQVVTVRRALLIQGEAEFP